MPIGITLGDFNGIGPEITLAALQQPVITRLRARFVVIGAAHAVTAGAEITGAPLPPPWHPGAVWPEDHSIVQWDPAPAARRWQICPGRVSAAAGRAAGIWLQAAVKAIRQGRLAGMVTAPVCKQSLHRAGWRRPGQTEWLGELSGAQRVGMLLLGGKLRVILVTRHLRLAAVPAAVTCEAIVEAGELLATGLAWLGTAHRRIGVCALDPHAGDGGLLGDADKLIVGPAVRQLQRKGLTIDGPVPADVIFHLARTGRYAGIVSLYHDQGLGPLKMAAFFQGVNLTLGLPFVRTSPDHGTAFDLAGRGLADPRSMVAALRLAVRLAARPNPWAVPRWHTDPPENGS